jgi:translation initiation factor IF-1
LLLRARPSYRDNPEFTRMRIHSGDVVLLSLNKFKSN